MVDVHSHVLPGIDDGAETVEESLDMLKEAYTQGVRYVVATPHCHVSSDEDVRVFMDKRTQAFERLKAAMDCAEGPFPKILLGAEVALNSYLSHLESLELLCIEGTKCILLEPMFENMSEALSEWIYEIGLKGFVPIVAHIDRYKDEALERMGIFQLEIVFQLNASVFLTLSGRRRVKHFISEGELFVVGSDMHNMHVRKCEMEKALKWAKMLFGNKASEWFENNARSLFEINE